MADSITIQNNNIMPLVDDLRQIINQTRSRVAINVNAELTLMYWHIGERINQEVLGNERTEYGKQIVSAVSTQLTWSHIIEILPLKDDLQREFYLTFAASERWSVRRLAKKSTACFLSVQPSAASPKSLSRKNSLLCVMTTSCRPTSCSRARTSWSLRV